MDGKWPHPLTVACCQQLGYGASTVVGLPPKTDGGNVTERDIAEAASEAYQRHFSELPAVACGMSKKDTKRAVKQHEREAKRVMAEDVAAKFGLDERMIFGIGAGLLLFLFGGPVAIVVAIIAAVFSWYIESLLDERLHPADIAAAAAFLR